MLLIPMTTADSEIVTSLWNSNDTSLQRFLRRKGYMQMNTHESKHQKVIHQIRPTL